ncbi:oxidoreductase [Dehalobacter sp. DCM]|uniref:oxidoreductase n=1 Tax=Dehalobacter sp. DCM TaxID=2907827 RepID=UPI003081EA33|nr:oxidoreductase [Dehalobacter sp. DCM]
MSANGLDNQKYGLLINYDFCTGCHSCEMACKKEFGLAQDQFGIKVAQYGPVQNSGKKWEFFYMPMLTDLCTLCAPRVAEGKLPTCVHHCQAKVMQYGTIDDLAEQLKVTPKSVLFAPKCC